jgi:2-(1,2-epoxy-1,2-dihydrophenyl)acetyl-CoA isomerase
MTRREIATGTEQCVAHEEDAVAVITLNRPQARNALTQEMLGGLEKALDDAERAPSVRAVVVTGAGGAFCAGGDVKNMASRSDAAGPTLDERIHLQRLSQRNIAGRIFSCPSRWSRCCPALLPVRDCR